MKHFVKHFLTLMLALTLVLSVAPVPARAAQTVVYDAQEIAAFQRSSQEVADRYNAAMKAGSGYIDGDSSSYYSRAASTKAPYDQGKLKQSTLDAMIAMTNYMRWLTGVEPLTRGATNNDALQRAALIRNFDFNHDVDDAKKPADMPKSLWDSGMVWHNILSYYYSPRGAIIGWCNEGYDMDSKSWNTIGHRYSLVSCSVSALDFGYSGAVGIGVCEYDGSTSLPFTAFPCPGPMPTNLLKAKRSSWTVEHNTELLTVKNTGDLKVTVTCVNTGKSYVCTSANGKLKLDPWYGVINFVQPACDGENYPTGSVYRVTVSGLLDKATEAPVELRYQVEFFDVSKPQSTHPPVFQDVQDPSAYYYDAVYWAYTHKPYQVTAGIDATHFGPNQTVTRAQAMTFFWAALDRPKFKKASSQFVDVRKSDWYYKPVMWALENGVTAGTDATHFSPNKTCNRGEILTFLYASLKKPTVTISNPYKDVKNQWYRKAALWAYSESIETGENGKFNASTPCTRAAVVTYLYQFEKGNPVCKNSHDWKQIEKQAPTCTEKGFEKFKCNRCGAAETRNEKKALGHDFKLIETVVPTETSEGYDLYQCSRCSAKEHRNSKPRRLSCSQAEAAAHAFAQQNGIGIDSSLNANNSTYSFPDETDTYYILNHGGQTWLNNRAISKVQDVIDKYESMYPEDLEGLTIYCWVENRPEYDSYRIWVFEG